MSEAAGIAENKVEHAETTGTGRWVFVSRVAVQASQLAIFLVGVRVLDPSEFGVFALVQAFSILLFTIGAAGWQEFIMSWRGPDGVVNQAITYAMLAGLGMFLAGIMVAGGLFALFHLPTVALLLLLLSGCALLLPAASAFSGILVRSGRVNELAFAVIAAEAAGLAVAIPALLAGWGIVALGAGKLAVQLVTAAVVCWRAQWPFRMTLRAGQAKEMLHFSGQILANRVIFYLENHCTVFVVGAFLGPAGAGFFRASERVVSCVSELVMEPLKMIAWVHFRRAAHGASGAEDVRAHLAAEAHRLLPLFLVAAAPVYVGLALVSGRIVDVILGEQWLPAAPVVAILAISALSMIVHSATEPLLSLSGQIRRLPPVLLLNAVITVAVMAVLGPYGLHALAASSLIGGLVGLAPVIWLVGRYVGVRWGAAFVSALPAAVALAAMIGAIVALRSYSGEQPLFVEVALGAGVYVGTLLIIRPGLVRSVLSM